ncbi:FISUMP domain-containing protein, partial [Mariniradius saccharolyticus]
RDGNVYKIVKIGDQVWFAENLKYASGICYDNQPENCEEYGYLYEGTPECPLGWHVPSKGEWEILINHLGGSELAGGKLKSVEGWNEPNVGATNESGFTGLPGGQSIWVVCCEDETEFFNMGIRGVWWSSTGFVDEENPERFGPYLMSLSNGENAARINEVNINETIQAFSCRCIKD